MQPINVLVIDDSAPLRQALRDRITADPRLRLLGMAADPYEAARLMRVQAPDVITLDIEMPGMNGLTFLAKLMRQHPLPVVVFSSMSTAGSQAAAAALSLGAADVLAKPSGGEAEWEETFSQLTARVYAIGQAVWRPRFPEVAQSPAPNPLGAAAPRRKDNGIRLIVMGASTGGPQTLEYLLTQLGPETPGIAITQHMPGLFTHAFASRLNDICALEVREAADGDLLRPGMALIAPGGYHLTLQKALSGFRARITDGMPVNRHKPSVDVLFRSAAQAAGAETMGILLTGMGNDGAAGLLALRQAGARTIAQDENSSIVYGMPKEAARLGAAERELSLVRILKVLQAA